MKRLIFTLLVLPAILCSCQFSENKKETTTPPTNSALSQEIFDPIAEGYQLHWEDNFEGTELDLTKWRPRGTGPRRIGYNNPSMIEVKDGQLHLMYDIKGDSIMGSAIGTYETFNTTYGYFECRAQMQKSIGPWAAFWMQSPAI